MRLLRCAVVILLMASCTEDGPPVGAAGRSGAGGAGAGGEAGGSGGGAAGMQGVAFAGSGPGSCRAAVEDDVACPDEGFHFRCDVVLGSVATRGCFNTQLDCSTVVDCDGNGNPDTGCQCGELLLACPGLDMGRCGRPGQDDYCVRSRSLTCPEMDKPFYCPASGLCYAGDGATVDCATVRDCDGDGRAELACGCGKQPDCATRSCL